jgi:ketosteroid isomerase-like protein
MPAQPQRGEALIELVRNGAFPSAGVTMEGEEMVEMVMEVLAAAAHPEYVTLMVDQSGHPNEYRGIEGFREGLADWMSPYERFQLRFDEVVQAGDEALVFLVRQTGVTKHGGVEVESRGAAVFWLKDGAIGQSAFYIDQRAALKAAGLDPDRPSAG